MKPTERLNVKVKIKEGLAGGVLCRYWRNPLRAPCLGLGYCPLQQVCNDQPPDVVG